MVRKIRTVHPNVPIIGFPKGAGSLYTGYREQTGVTALGLDWSVPWSQARALQAGGAVQGNLDPLRLVAGGAALRDGVEIFRQMWTTGSATYAGTYYTVDGAICAPRPLQGTAAPGSPANGIPMWVAGGGEKVTLKIDAYPGRTINGHVESVQPGSGTAFSLLPAQNATGNWVKIAQRVPVRIRLLSAPGQPQLRFREFRDARIARRLHERQRIARRVQAHPRRGHARAEP